MKLFDNMMPQNMIISVVDHMAYYWPSFPITLGTRVSGFSAVWISNVVKTDFTDARL